MKFLILGGLGYIGRVLQEELRKKGHEFEIVDNDLMSLHNWDNKLDITDSNHLTKIEEMIKTSDMVVSLAAVVGDQACLEDTKQAMNINCQGIQHMVKLCNKLNKKMIHLSTCSLYGSSKEILNENSQTFPVDFYGQTKYQQERYILESSRDYCVFRLGTAYGWSPRMRFDLVVNTFTAKKFNKERITVFGGNQWRPFVHIHDISRGIIFAAEKNLEGVYNLCNENITIDDLAKKIAGDETEIELNSLQADPRDYKVDNSKILNEGFTFEWNIDKGVKGMLQHTENITDYNDPRYSNYKMAALKDKMPLKILMLGSKGMAGHMLSQYLKENTDWEIFDSDKSTLEISDDSDWRGKMIALHSEKKFDFLINCIGVLKPDAIKNPILAVKLNSLFPHELAQLCTSLRIKIVHISTDCWNDLDIYGRSKRAGELDYPEHLTIRTSIIGPELKSNGSGLFHWFMSQEGETNGFIGHYWDGVTTLELAKNILSILKNKPESNHIMDFRTKEKLNKLELVSHIKEIFNKEITVHPKETELMDKTNSNPDRVSEKTLKNQIEELKEWMLNHKDIYAQYLNLKISSNFLSKDF